MKIVMSAILLLTMLTGHAMAQAGNAAATAAATAEPPVKQHLRTKTVKRHRAVTPKH